MTLTRFNLSRFIGLDEPIDRLTAGQRLALFAVTLIAAVTRWLALSRTLWDWDEALFSLALRHYDVVEHHPHPPGFPLFVGTAQLFRWIGFDSFHALQAVNLLAAIAIVPAMFLLARELRAGFAASLAAAAFLAFFPNVLIYGGTALSDIPSMTLVIVAVALLLRGCRNDRSFLLGAAVLGIAAGFRPQNLAIGALPALLAVLSRPRVLRALAGLAVVVTIVTGSYLVAARLSGGWAAYREAVQSHEQYITHVDSFHSPLRPPLYFLFDDFFIRPYRQPFINTIVTALVAIGGISGLVRRRRPVVLALTTFGPLCVLAWLYLDHFSVSRFSIGYAPLVAFLAADGLHVLLQRAPHFETAAATALTLGMFAWTWPSLRIVHQTASPPAAAVQWIRANVDRHHKLYVHLGMQPYAEESLPRHTIEYVHDLDIPARWNSRDDGLYLAEGAINASGARVFRRPHEPLWDLVRQRYFEVSIVPVHADVAFGDGWYPEEGDATHVWRWMGRKAMASLPPIEQRNARLTLRLYVPLDVLHGAPTITIRMNGNVLDRIVATSENVARTWDVTPAVHGPNELVIETDRAVNPAAANLRPDSRDLGVRLGELTWVAAPRQSEISQF